MTPLKIIAVSILAAAGLAAQDTSFQVKRMKEWNEQSRDGRCVLRVMVDDEVDVELRGDQVLVRRISGQPGRDDGSECTQPLPRNFFTRFSLRGVDGRGEVRLSQEPRPGNNFTAIVTIRDTRRGQEGYTFELSWTTDGQPYQGSMESTGSRGGGGYFGNSETPAPVQAPPPTQPQGGGILPTLSRRPGGDFQPTPQPPAGFSGLNEMVVGSGTLRAGSQTDNLRRVRASLKSNGDLELQCYGSEVVTLKGRWTAKSEGIELEITDGFASLGSSGRGRLNLGPDGKMASLELRGTLGKPTDSFEIRFQR
ncbi:MAG: hypothetical protein JNL98_19065 [Bryobacterales bacterium]|nr:hypothetical protein [Bryobacterales bacterium]